MIKSEFSSKKSKILENSYPSLHCHQDGMKGTDPHPSNPDQSKELWLPRLQTPVREESDPGGEKQVKAGSQAAWGGSRKPALSPTGGWGREPWPAKQLESGAELHGGQPRQNTALVPPDKA